MIGFVLVVPEVLDGSWRRRRRGGGRERMRRRRNDSLLRWLIL